MYLNQLDQSTVNFKANKGFLLSQGDFARFSLSNYYHQDSPPPFPLYSNFPPRYETLPEITRRYRIYRDNSLENLSDFEMDGLQGNSKSKHGNEKRRTDYITKNIVDVQEASKLLRKTPGARHKACLSEASAGEVVVPSKRLIYPTPVTRKMRYPQLHELQEQPVTKNLGHKDTPRPDKVMGIKLEDQEIYVRRKENENTGSKTTASIVASIDGIDPPINFNEICSENVLAGANEPVSTVDGDCVAGNSEITPGDLPGIMKDLKISPVIFDLKQATDEKSVSVESSQEKEEPGERRVSFEDKVEVIDSEESPEERQPKKSKRYISVCERKATPVPSSSKLSRYSEAEIGDSPTGDGANRPDVDLSHLRGDRLNLDESMDECSFVLNAIPDCYNVVYETEDGDTFVLSPTMAVVDDSQVEETPGMNRKLTDESLDWAMLKASMVETPTPRSKNDQIVVRLDCNNQGLADADVIILKKVKSEEKRWSMETRIFNDRRVISIDLDQANAGERIFDVKKGESFSFTIKSNRFLSIDVAGSNSVARFTRSDTSSNVNSNEANCFESAPTSASSSSSGLSLPVRERSNLNVYAKPFYPSSSGSSAGNLTRATSESNATLEVDPFVNRRFSNRSLQDPGGNCANRLLRSPDYVVEKAAELLQSMSETELELGRMLRSPEDGFEFP